MADPILHNTNEINRIYQLTANRIEPITYKSMSKRGGREVSSTNSAENSLKPVFDFNNVTNRNQSTKNDDIDVNAAEESRMSNVTKTNNGIIENISNKLQENVHEGRQSSDSEDMNLSATEKPQTSSIDDSKTVAENINRIQEGIMSDIQHHSTENISIDENTAEETHMNEDEHIIEINVTTESIDDELQENNRSQEEQNTNRHGIKTRQSLLRIRNDSIKKTTQEKELGEKKYSCDMCGKKFTEKRSIKRHFQRFHMNNEYDCNLCPKSFKTQDNLRQHQKIHYSTKKKKEEIEKTQY